MASTNTSTGGTNPPTGGGTNNPADGMPPPNSATPEGITDLTNDLRDLTKNTEVNLKEDTAAEYLKAIQEFISTLMGKYTQMLNLTNLGDPGTLKSAQLTKTNLNNDVTGHDGIEALTGGYVLYLVNFMELVQKSTKKMVEHG